MITFLCAVLLLIGGYFLYGKMTEHIFRPDSRPTPAVDHPDGVDYVPMKTWRVFLIQLLNIAGTCGNTLCVAEVFGQENPHIINQSRGFLVG